MIIFDNVVVENMVCLFPSITSNRVTFIRKNIYIYLYIDSV